MNKDQEGFRPSPESGGSASGEGHSVNDIRDRTAALKARVEKARAQKVKDVEKNVADRGSLIGKAKQTSELLAEAQSALEYYASLDEMGELSDEDRSKYQELQATEQGLREQAVVINDKVDALSSVPEVIDKIRESADQEQASRKEQETIRDVMLEFTPKMQKISESLIAAGRELTEELPSLQEQAKADYNMLRAQIEPMIERAQQAAEKARGVVPLLYGWDDRTGFIGQLETGRQQYGALAFKEKGIIDSLLKHRSLFEQLAQAMERRRQLDQEREKIWKMPDELRGLRDKTVGVAKQTARERGATNVGSMEDDLKNVIARHISEQLDLKNEKGQDIKIQYMNKDEVKKHPQSELVSTVRDLERMLTFGRYA